MNDHFDSLDWNTKPKIRHKWLSYIFFVAGCYLFYTSFDYAQKVYQKHFETNVSGIDMNALAKDLINLKVAPLDSIEINLNKLELLFNIGLGDVEIRYPESDTTNNQIPLKPNSDNIGKFYRIEVVFFGDMYEQLYFLSKFNLLRDIVMIDSMNANQRNIIIKARLYGQ